jgi:uncharacterized NAD(P)/FAD-binding protein YdhS
MKEIAIVGCGPRGLHSLECLMDSLSRKRDQPKVKITIYEKETYLGSGQVWKLDQPDANWLNIADSALVDLKGRSNISFDSFEIPAFPSFIEWMEKVHNHKIDDEVDAFPARNKMGAYLNERYKTISKVLLKENLLLVKQTLVNYVQFSNDKFLITDNSKAVNKFDECLLTIGHQPVEDDSQIESWKSSCTTGNKLLFDNPYEREIIDQIKSEDVVGLRGFGLAMIDMMRQLTIEKGARFKKTPHDWKLSYHPSNSSIKTIIPFSLDGLPMVPKPLGKNVDSFFKPSPLQLDDFKSKIYSHLRNAESLNNIEFLLDAFVPIAVAKYREHPSFTNETDQVTIEIVAKEWLNDKSFEHDIILDTKIDPKDYISQTIEMALGKKIVSLDFVIGQVWRHLQPTMYDLFSHSHLHDLVMAQIIELDESTKRYSYGPPVESMIQLHALIENGVITTNYLSNPNIKCNDTHWVFSKNENDKKCTVMINTVLDPPQLREINSTIVKELLHDKLLEPVTSDLGIATNKDGTIRLSHINDQIRLASLGRNCKGSVMGVDAILECFGNRIKNWSDAIVQRL